ncbi:MAG TPA: S8 family serine peptidase [Candidatus Eisenbacteria bacterium]|nr:S8 family serine peptidase [Candidatus Eisenbacteria bacterium]
MNPRTVALLVLGWMMAAFTFPGSSHAATPGAPAGAPARRERHASFAPPAPRAAEVLSAAALARMRAEGRSVLWVHFTDKGIPDAAAFEREIRAAGERVDTKTRARRARETGGAFVPDFYDLPVRSQYVDAVRATGVRVRHVSKWLNAMTVVADEAQARRIAALPYVRVVHPARPSRKVEPVGIGPAQEGVAPEADSEQGSAPAPGTDGTGLTRAVRDLPGPEPAFAALPKPISYGNSLTALTGINVPAAHDSGWSGASVVLAMFDSGFDKNHNTTSLLVKIGERDFVFHDNNTSDEPGQDAPGHWQHGTGCWSVAGGYWSSNLVGPAFNSRFVLAKTEYNPTETPVEEDNWVAAAEWADSLGTDVISSSLAYKDFDGTANDYDYSDLDGYTTVVAQGAIMAARRGIVVATATGNSGGAAGSLWSPSDADSILGVGSVNNVNIISGFSGRGPTADGRIKPDVVAQGEAVWWAIAGSASQVGQANGTSLATPLVAGGAALVREAHPEWSAAQVRSALLSTADKAATPDNNFGYGRINVAAAIYNSSLGAPVAPRPFNLLVPINNGIVDHGPTIFRWRRTTDPQGGALSYRVTLRSIAPQPCCLFTFTTSDTFFSYTGYLGPNRTYEWTVTAIDPQNNERESRDFFRFTTNPTTSVPVPEPPPGVPQVVLRQNRPNPVRSFTQVDFELAGTQGWMPVSLRIYDAAGRLVRTLLQDFVEPIPTQCSVTWDGNDDRGRRASSGIYYYRLEVGEAVESRRLVLLR